MGGGGVPRDSFELTACMCSFREISSFGANPFVGTANQICVPDFRCASTNASCKLQIPVFETTKEQEQNYESVRPSYEKMFCVCGGSCVSRN